MEDLSKEAIKNLCRQTNLRPQRSGGQNFLVNENILQEIISASQLKATDEVLEIGPGFGFLTEEIGKHVQKVIAVELDKRMAFFLKEKFKNTNNIEIIQADIFDIKLEDYFEDLRYKLISNLPYNITSLVLRNFLSLKPRPREMILTLQKEVAERITAQPGSMSVLAVICQFYSQPSIIRKIDKENFWPRPEINSCLITFQDIGKPKFELQEEPFIKLVKVGFSARRKKLTNNLKNGMGISPEISEKVLKSLGLNSTVRAQELSLENWVNLANNFL